MKVFLGTWRPTVVGLAVLVCALLSAPAAIAAAGFSPSQPGFAFGSFDIAAAPSAPAFFRITNSSVDDLVITDASITGADAADFVIGTNECDGATRIGGAFCDVTVTFDPSTPGAKSANLHFEHNAPGGPTDLPLTGTATASAVIGVDPVSWDYANQPVAAGPTVARNFRVQNYGSAALNIASITLTGADAAQFALVTDCTSASLVTPAFCDTTVTFDPSSVGTKTANLRFTHNADDGVTEIPLTGAGTVPGISGPASIDFAPRDVLAGASAASAAVITNTGLAPLTITAAVMTGANPGDFFAVDSTCFGGPVLAGSSCTINTFFDPTAVGARTATLEVASNAGADIGIPLTGTGTVSPQFSVGPASHDYGTLSTTADGVAQFFRVINPGSANLGISSVALTGTGASSFTIDTNACTGASVPPQAPETNFCDVVVSFNPSTAGAKSADLVFTHNAAGGTTSVPLTGTAIAPNGGVSPSALTFAARDIGAGGSATQTVTVSNTGLAPLVVSSIEVTGTNAAEFYGTDVSCFAAPIPASGSCTVNVAFDPAAVGTRTGVLEITNNAGPDLTVALSGTGTAAAVFAIDPTSHAYGTVATTAEPLPRTFRIHNTGSAPMDITNVALTGTDTSSFAITGNDCVATDVPFAPPTNFCDVSVTFDPTTAGAKSADLVFTHNAAGGTTSVPLTGTAIAPDGGVSPSALIFADRDIDDAASAAQTVTLTNTGDAPLTVGSIVATGSGADQFGIGATTCYTGTIAPAATCTVAITFDPSSAGAKTATLSFTHNGPTSPATVALSGTGTATAEFSVEPLIGAFGNDPIESIEGGPTNPINFRVTNNGSAPLVFSNVQIVGANPSEFVFATPASGVVDPDTCSDGPVAPGAFCDVALQFDPAVAGARAATLRFSHNAAGATTDIPLTGTGTEPLVVVSPSAISFGSRNVDDGASALTTVTITNSGAAPLTITGVTLIGANADQFVMPVADQLCSERPTIPNIPVGGTCTIKVQFDPTAVTPLPAKGATIRITHNGGGIQQSDIDLAGTAIRPHAAFNPTSLAFGRHAVGGAASPAQTVTLTNSGSDHLKVSSVSIASPDYIVLSENCTTAGTPAPPAITPPVGLAPSASCTASVAFKPTARGNRPASLRFAHNKAPETISLVSLSGSGDQPEFAVTPTFHTFPTTAAAAGESVPQFFRIENRGSGPMTLGQISLAGANPGDFVVGGNICSGRTLSATGGICDVPVSFDPTASGPRTATLRIPHNAPGGIGEVPLAGTGTVTPPDPPLVLIAKALPRPKMTKLRTVKFEVRCPKVVCNITGNAVLLLPGKGKKAKRSTLGFKRAVTKKGGTVVLSFPLYGAQRAAIARAARAKKKVSIQASFTAWAVERTDG
ncbi:MAG: choice-of-anchor D domain-containing protein, partial [Solirubrobacterales bacterium]